MAAVPIPAAVNKPPQYYFRRLDGSYIGGRSTRIYCQHIGREEEVKQYRRMITPSLSPSPTLSFAKKAAASSPHPNVNGKVHHHRDDDKANRDDDIIHHERSLQTWLDPTTIIEVPTIPTTTLTKQRENNGINVKNNHGNDNKGWQVYHRHRRQYNVNSSTFTKISPSTTTTTPSTSNNQRNGGIRYNGHKDSSTNVSRHFDTNKTALILHRLLQKRSQQHQHHPQPNTASSADDRVPLSLVPTISSAVVMTSASSILQQPNEKERYFVSRGPRYSRLRCLHQKPRAVRRQEQIEARRKLREQNHMRMKEAQMLTKVWCAIKEANLVATREEIKERYRPKLKISDMIHDGPWRRYHYSPLLSPFRRLKYLLTLSSLAILPTSLIHVIASYARTQHLIISGQVDESQSHLGTHMYTPSEPQLKWSRFPSLQNTWYHSIAWSYLLPDQRTILTNQRSPTVQWSLKAFHLDGIGDYQWRPWPTFFTNYNDAPTRLVTMVACANYQSKFILYFVHQRTDMAEGDTRSHQSLYTWSYKRNQYQRRPNEVSHTNVTNNTTNYKSNGSSNGRVGSWSHMSLPNIPRRDPKIMTGENGHALYIVGGVPLLTTLPPSPHVDDGYDGYDGNGNDAKHEEKKRFTAAPVVYDPRSVERYDPETCKWTIMPSMTIERRLPQVIDMKDGILVFGGQRIREKG
jgi:hypothetical protein